MSPAAKTKPSQSKARKSTKRAQTDDTPPPPPTKTESKTEVKQDKGGENSGGGATKKKRNAGLSFDEKRERTLRFMTKSGTVFQLKELEALLPKFERVVSQTVREVVETLVAEGEVRCEKVGSSNYYWAFPRDTVVQLQQRIEAVRKEAESLASTTKQIEGQTREIMEKNASEITNAGFTKTKQYDELVASCIEMEKKCKAAEERVAGAKRMSTMGVTQRREATEAILTAASRWDDNLMELVNFVGNQLGISRLAASRALDVTLPKDAIDDEEEVGINVELEGCVDGGGSGDLDIDRGVVDIDRGLVDVDVDRGGDRGGDLDDNANNVTNDGDQALCDTEG